MTTIDNARRVRLQTPKTLPSTKQLMYRRYMAKQSPFITCSAILAVVGFTSIALAGDRGTSLVVTVDGADSICAESDVSVADAHGAACVESIHKSEVAESECFVEPLASDAGGYQECVAACRAGGSTIVAYCYRMPTPQFVAMCLAASAIGTVSCLGFCWSRFRD
jgi:hypothetical protein